MLLIKSVTNVCFHVKYLLILSIHNQTCIFSKDFSKNPQNKLHEICPLAAMLLHKTDRQTDTMKHIVTFHNFVNVPKSVYMAGIQSKHLRNQGFTPIWDDQIIYFPNQLLGPKFSS
jgi:hypothetical protein